jgi:hypothetical protein
MSARNIRNAGAPARPHLAAERGDEHRQDERLDEALAETFPASDPVAVTLFRVPATSPESGGQ